MKKTLYVYRPLLNAHEVIAWARENGFASTLKPSDMHVTQMFSRTPVDWNQIQPQNNHLVSRSLPRTLAPLGDKGAQVLKFPSKHLQDRWQQLLQVGCSWDYPDYNPHVTISYQPGPDLNTIHPWLGELRFGPEQMEELDLNWDLKIVEK